MCHVTPHNFTLLLDRCFTAFTTNTTSPSPNPHLSHDLPPLLSTLALAAHSSSCSAILTSSLLLSSIINELCETFTNLSSQTQAHRGPDISPSGGGVTATLPNLPRLCTLLAFLTDFSRDWTPAQVCLGNEHAKAMWIPLLCFLSLADNHPQLISRNELVFLQNVGLEFFRAVMTGNMSNKISFVHLFINSLKGDFSFEQNSASESKGTPNTTVSLTDFTHRLLIELILEPEICLVVLESSGDSSSSSSLLHPSSLPLTYESDSFFHPSLSISQQSHLVSLPVSTSLSEVSQLLCQGTSPPVSTTNDNEKTSVTLEPPTPVATTTSLSSQQQKKWSSHLQKVTTSQDGKNKKSKSSGEKVQTSHQQDELHPSQVQFSLSPNTSYIEHSKTLCQLMHTITTSLNCLSLIIHSEKASSPRLPISNPLSSDVDKNHRSMLEIFADNGGLILLSHCLSSLYPQYWSTFITKDSSDHAPSRSYDDGTYHHPLTGSDLLSPHVLVTFGLCLRLCYYGDTLMKRSLTMACRLITLLLGAECKGQCVSY